MNPPENQEASQLGRSAEAYLHASDLGAHYLRHLQDRRVTPDGEAIRHLAQFDEGLPEGPSDPRETLDLLDRAGSPATVATAAGRYFGYVVGGTLPAALGARTLASAWDQVVLNTSTSPVGVKLEQIAGAWLLDVLQLPAQCAVGFTTGASVANFTCLATARNALLSRKGWNVRQKGLAGAPPLRIVAPEEVHVTVIKALSLLGIGSETVERVACDDQGRLRLEALPPLDTSTIVVVQAGNVHSGACDPVWEVCRIAQEAGAWVHVDGAFGLWAAASPATAWQIEGHHLADSWATDGHKWLNTPYDCGVAITRNPDCLVAAMGKQAAYITGGASASPHDMVPEFSRATRGVEVWAALRSLGRQGITDLIDRCCSHARHFAAGLEAAGFEVLNDVVLNQIVATLPGQEDKIGEFISRVQDSGEAWFGPTVWKGRPAFRISVSSWVTDSQDVERALAILGEMKSSLDEAATVSS